jgi:hydroxyacylglutathione hydrolase
LIVDVRQPIILITEKGNEEEAVTRLARIGFDNVIGYLDGGFATWKDSGKESDKVNRISPEQFKSELKIGETKVIDVRKDSEYAAEHVEEAFSRPLSEINTWFNFIETDKPFYLHCAGGYRSMIAASILKARGIHNFKEVEGGFTAIALAGIPKSDFVCQSKLQTS